MFNEIYTMAIVVIKKFLRPQDDMLPYSNSIQDDDHHCHQHHCCCCRNKMRKISILFNTKAIHSLFRFLLYLDFDLIHIWTSIFMGSRCNLIRWPNQIQRKGANQRPRNWPITHFCCRKTASSSNFVSYLAQASSHKPSIYWLGVLVNSGFCIYFISQILFILILD